MSMHEGHRQRLKGRFLESGIDGFTEVQVLELLLFYSIPRKDTNPIAHRLLERFGSLARVMDAPLSELVKVDGVTENTAVLLKMQPAISRRYQVSRSKDTEILPSLDACAEYLVPRFVGRTEETAFILCMDARCRVLCCREVGAGVINSAVISTRKILETAISSGASVVVLAHNHPCGLALPSDQDKLTTKQLAAALRAAEIQLLDHIIVADEDYVSMAQSGTEFNRYLLI